MYKEVIVFQPIMDGVERIAIPKKKGNGYSHSERNGIHVYKHGHIKYMIDATAKEVFITKNISGEPACVSHDEFRKFITIQRVK